jgi:hypothetical protein
LWREWTVDLRGRVVTWRDRHSGVQSDVYRRALLKADRDALHEVVVRNGAEILECGVPYIVVSARHRAARERKRAARDVSIDKADESWLSVDPYEQIEKNDTLRGLINHLATLPDEDVVLVWAHAQGASTEEMRKLWQAAGFEPKAPTLDALRKRLQRAHEKLRAMVRAE